MVVASRVVVAVAAWERVVQIRWALLRWRWRMGGSDADEGVDTEHDGGRGARAVMGWDGRRGEDVEGYLERWTCGWGDE